jgi:cell wall-associated NlpC family hydrolase
MLVSLAVAGGCGPRPTTTTPPTQGLAGPAPGGTFPPPARGGAHSGATPGELAASFALAQLGRPYCWGGHGPGCYDCSGLTQASWRAAGLAIPRTSTAQHERIPTVPLAALAPGDILWRPGHVGLYVGNGRAVHAPGEGRLVSYQPSGTYQAAHRPW